MLGITRNFLVFIPSGFIIGRKIGRNGWFYAIVTPFFAECAEAIALVFLVGFTSPWRYLAAVTAVAILAGFVGGILGQVSKMRSTPGLS